MNVGTKVSREKLLRSSGKGLGLMALLSPTVAALLEHVRQAGGAVTGLDPIDAARLEPYWNQIAEAFAAINPYSSQLLM